MKLIIAGGRDFTDFASMKFHADHLLWRVSTVVTGMANGADKLGIRWAKENSIYIEFHPALWKRFGARAGPIRNDRMADSADELLAFWDGESRGTCHMIQTMKKRNKPVTLVLY